MADSIRVSQMPDGGYLQNTDKLYAIRGSGVGADKYVTIPLVTDSSNTLLGDAIFANGVPVGATENTLFGVKNMFISSAGIRNAFFGFECGRANEGDYNTAMGRYALYANVTGDNNVALGASALNQSTGNQNIGLGESAGLGLTSGNNNIFIGALASAPASATSDYLNIGGALTGAVGGIKSLNSVGDFSVATNKLTVASATGNTLIAGTLGVTGAMSAASYGAVSGTTGAFSSTLSCTGNLAVNTDKFNVSGTTGECVSAKRFHTGSLNSVFGDGAFASNVSGVRISAFGVSALAANTLAVDNSAFGHEALKAHVGAGLTYNGRGNSAFGSGALKASTEGVENSAFGFDAGSSITNGGWNTLIGASAGKNLTSAVGNVALGHLAQGTSTTSAYCVALGGYALGNLTTGSGNVAVGYEAGKSSTTVGGCTFVGYAAGKFTNFADVTCIGAFAAANAANEVQIGKADTGPTVYASSAVVTRSDERDKADIQVTALGLGFIKALRPVDYRYDMRESYYEYIDKVELVEDENGVVTEVKEVEIVKHPRDGSNKRKRFHHGFIAQDIEKIIEDTGIDFGGFKDCKVSGGNDVLSIAHEEFIAPIVKAIQEQQAMIEKQQDIIAQLQSRLAKLEAK